MLDPIWKPLEALQTQFSYFLIIDFVSMSFWKITFLPYSYISRKYFGSNKIFIANNYQFKLLKKNLNLIFVLSKINRSNLRQKFPIKIGCI